MKYTENTVKSLWDTQTIKCVLYNSHVDQGFILKKLRSRGAIVLYNNNQPLHLLEMDYKIWPNIQQRREAKGRIVVIEVPTHPPPPPPLNPPKLVIKSEETNLQESTFFSLNGFATKQV